MSNAGSDNRMVFGEGALVALRNASLSLKDFARHATIDSKPNPVHPELIRAAVVREYLPSTEACHAS